MTLFAQLQFDPNAEAATAKGWTVKSWSDANISAVTTETFHRLYNPTGVATISNKALTSNVATLTTSTAHGFVVGQYVTVAGVDAVFNGEWLITAVPSGTTFSFAKTNANIGSTAASGTATPTKSAFERMRELFSGDATIRSYFLTQAQTTLLNANTSTINTNRDALLTAEGLVP